MKSGVSKVLNSVNLKDANYFCNVLWTLQNEDVFLADFYLLKDLLSVLRYSDFVWISSDNRVLLTVHGQDILQELLGEFVDFKPKFSKLQDI